ncbi:MAG TPA: hypothetical protein VFU69_19830, partial [Ktedonobacterales bacterium]|nr:hypothetical protein [Ktedonobacterales bacterium]
MPESERPIETTTETKTRARRPATRRRYRVLAVGHRWRGEFIRQSSLFALVVLGPFLLLALFAVGFRLSA